MIKEKYNNIELPEYFYCHKHKELPIIKFSSSTVLWSISKNRNACYCLDCDKENRKKNYERHKEKIKKLSQDWYFSNLDKAKERRKKYYEENQESIKKYRKENREKAREYERKRQKDNGLCIKSTRIWNGTNTEYNLNDFLNNKGIVYFIGDIHGLYVKIGITSSIFSLSHRFRTIQGCNPMPLKLLGFIQDDNAAKLERRLHEQFKIHNRIGEWFVISPDINRYIKENCMHIELANTMIGETYLSLPSILADDLGY